MQSTPLEPADKSKMIHQFLDSFDRKKFSEIAVPLIQEIQSADPTINTFCVSRFPCFIKNSLSSYIASPEPYCMNEGFETLKQKDQEILSKAQPIYPLALKKMSRFDLFGLEHFNMASVLELLSTQDQITPLTFETQCIDSSLDDKIEKIWASSIAEGPYAVSMAKILIKFSDSIDIQENKYEKNSDFMFYVLNVLTQKILSSVEGKKQYFFFRYGCGFLNPSKTQQTLFCRDFHLKI